MTGCKAVKKDTYYGKYSNTVVYEYRGRTYEVEYATCFTYCVTPAHIQHKDAQAKIDAIIEKEQNGIAEAEAHEDVNEALDKFFQFLETGEWAD